MTEQRVLDYRIGGPLDPRNKNYRVAAAPDDLMQRSRYWVPGPVLDQGREGACVGFGCTAEALASPVRVKTEPRPANMVARDVYLEAQRIDEWVGENYEGTSVLAGMKVGRERGWWSGFRWAMSTAELRAVSGEVVGGHCILVTGYTPRHRKLKVPGYRLRNSWSEDWGINGSAWIAADDLARILFQAGGEAAVPVGRAA